MRVAFIHPDLGIGGAERWLVDSALALSFFKHEIVIYTSHYDANHCFEETKQMNIICRGDFLPRHFVGKFYALFAYIRMLYLALYMLLFADFTPDVIICDQISACVPILKLTRAKVLFYCHFPDMLLTKRESKLKALYRYPIDWLEHYTTGLADRVMVNSRFTLNVFRETFTSLVNKNVDILYPSINISNFESIQPDFSVFNFYQSSKKYVLSLNRFERKKNIGLAIDAFVELRNQFGHQQWCGAIVLIIAGGYDSRVIENVEYFKELEEKASSSHLTVGENVIFLKSPSDVEKVTLLDMADLLLYTPSNEHFGIVPVESMYMKTPVVAVNSGGPLETIVHGVTGHLTEPNPHSFASAIAQVLSMEKSLLVEMGERGRDRVLQQFSFDAFSTKLDYFLIT